NWGLSRAEADDPLLPSGELAATGVFAARGVSPIGRRDVDGVVKADEEETLLALPAGRLGMAKWGEDPLREKRGQGMGGAERGGGIISTSSSSLLLSSLFSSPPTDRLPERRRLLA
ncbi:hypothetical protein PENTCL1PPCAC_3022, partial [Pristionchus entomophagus]